MQVFIIAMLKISFAQRKMIDLEKRSSPIKIPNICCLIKIEVEIVQIAVEIVAGCKEIVRALFVDQLEGH